MFKCDNVLLRITNITGKAQEDESDMFACDFCHISTIRCKYRQSMITCHVVCRDGCLNH